MAGCNFVLILIFTFICRSGASLTDSGTRRHAVPVLFVKGSHYDVGFDVGRTFGSLIKSFIADCDRLRQFVVEYETPYGRAAYDKTLANMRKRFPYYVREIEGIAEGANVPFHQLFLLQMDDIIETINENSIENNTNGCSSIGINEGILGHTEDAFSETLNHFYILSAHITPTPEDVAAGAREEKFSSLCYAGHLPGYTMGFNQHGLIFSINTLSPKHLIPGKTPRTFITRALLSAASFDDVQWIFRDKGLGAANGCSLNVFFVGPNNTYTLHNIEMAPNQKGNESMVNIEEYKEDVEFLVHCNKYQRLRIQEVDGPIIDSSNQRLSAFSKYNQPRNKQDIMKMLSDGTGSTYKVFQNGKDAMIRTIAVGIFDLKERTWSLFTDRPANSDPIAVLPIFINKI